MRFCSLGAGDEGGATASAMCSTPDITATVLDAANVKPHERVQGKSLVPVLTGKTNRHRSFTCSSVSFPPKGEGGSHALGTSVFYDGRYTYLFGGTDHKNELYDLKNDPMQKKNLIRKDRKRAEKMHHRFIRWCEELECPDEYPNPRREFVV